MREGMMEHTGERHPLPIVNDPADLDIEAELARFEAEERARLGLEEAPRKETWTESMSRPWFDAKERQRVTILVSGLTMAHDLLVEAVLKGLGYNIHHLDCPDNDALRYGKEFGNRAQCNPTYFTVGNLVKHLDGLRRQGLAAEEIIDRYVFLTAGACGPCRFGMYVTEYRKALRDAGFDGFRVLLFQQTGGFKQATGAEAGLKMDPPFFIGLAKAIFAGDVLNALTYRIRPYEVEPGATDRANEHSRKILYDALANKRSILAALWRCKGEFRKVKVDRTLVRPKASIIGEFWAMTTEGDGNYQLQRFLESEGAECDIQLVTAWLLYMLWEGRYDTTLRKELKGTDQGRKGLEGVNVAKKLAILHAADYVVRGVFQVFAHAIGLYDYHLPDLDVVNSLAAPHYNTLVRGGESYMEVGKLILNAIKKKANMTVSVKPFGCMPSSGVSDGVQTIVTEKYPGSIYCAVETSGDGRVNFYSRIQMFLFKAKLAAKEEVDKALEDTGLTMDEVRAFLEKNPRFASALHKAPHVVASSTADLVYEVAPYIRKTWLERQADRARSAAAFAKSQWAALPGRWEKAKALARKTPEYWRLARLEWKEASPALKEKVLEELKNRFGKAFFASADAPPPTAAEREGGSGGTSVRMAAMK
jgi:predicted nucleotide-binding protein (sugar kinase/HSP70/actin superfamily)